MINGWIDDKLTNAHLAFQGKSVIVDYEHCLRCYSEIPEGTVPVEVYPYKGDIDLNYIPLDKKFHKVDLVKLYEHLASLCGGEKEEKHEQQ